MLAPLSLAVIELHHPMKAVFGGLMLEAQAEPDEQTKKRQSAEDLSILCGMR